MGRVNANLPNEENLSREISPIQKRAVFGLNVFTALAFLVLFMPMEDFVLKFLPISDVLFTALHFFSEMLIYSLFAVVVVVRDSRHLASVVADQK